MIASCVRKHRMTPFVWIGLSLLFYSSFSLTVGQLYLSEMATDNCSFALQTIYSIDLAVIFNLSMLIGYKINCFCRDINGFALNGSLPSESFKN